MKGRVGGHGEGEWGHGEGESGGMVKGRVGVW